MKPVNELPVPVAKALVTDEARIAAQVANLPTPSEVQKMAAAVVVQAARDIVLGKLPFKSAGEASKVARDFVAIAKDMAWDDEAEAMKKAETQEDRQAAFEEFRKRAQQNLGK